MKTQQVAQDVAQTPTMRQNQTNLAELKAAYFDSYHPFLEALTVHGRAKKAYYDAVDALEEEASK